MSANAPVNINLAACPNTSQTLSPPVGRQIYHDRLDCYTSIHTPAQASALNDGEKYARAVTSGRQCSQVVVRRRPLCGSPRERPPGLPNSICPRRYRATHAQPHDNCNIVPGILANDECCTASRANECEEVTPALHAMNGNLDACRDTITVT